MVKTKRQVQEERTKKRKIEIINTVYTFEPVSFSCSNSFEMTCKNFNKNAITFLCTSISLWWKKRNIGVFSPFFKWSDNMRNIFENECHCDGIRWLCEIVQYLFGWSMTWCNCTYGNDYYQFKCTCLWPFFGSFCAHKLNGKFQIKSL